MRRDLTAVAALTAVTLACALASAPTAVTAVLGILVLLLAPGYVWLAALLPASGPSFERSRSARGMKFTSPRSGSFSLIMCVRKRLPLTANRKSRGVDLRQLSNASSVGR